MQAGFDGERLSLTELHRFVNEPLRVDSSLRWNFPVLLDEVKAGIRKAAAFRPVSVGIDTWAVDYGLIDAAGKLLELPYHYRDARTDGIMERLLAEGDNRDAIFSETGIQFLPFNTLYQLLAHKNSSKGIPAAARQLMMMPDLIHHALAGTVTGEYTNATSTQLVGARSRNWSSKLCDRFGIPANILPELVEPGTRLGSLTDEARSDIGFDLDVIAVGTHDTASAVASVPAAKRPFAYLSCGTWSLLGTEATEPVTGPEALAINVTNEGGIQGTYRLLKNIMGLWILQELKREWNACGLDYSWDDIASMAREGTGFPSLIDPDDARFLSPGPMNERIRNFCSGTHQPIPETPAAAARSVVASLALKYYIVLKQLEALTGARFGDLYMVGGGIQNQLLCQWTANATHAKVHAGPVEATAIGNAAVQLMAKGYLGSLAEVRAMVEKSFPIHEYQYDDGYDAAWDEPNQRLKSIIARSESC
ncbi:MAG: rhamnulokinase [Methylacidiphilales bacterium]|nr:rhamnulokinase [Candidatus Methylacidiphilales bacterium]